MHWKLKAGIQNAVSLLPAPASRACYYWIQRHFGGLRRINPLRRLSAGIETWKRIARQGADPSGKIFLEIGTGRIPLVPLACWLMGAGKIITLDPNPYLRAELIRDSVGYVSGNSEQVRNLFGALLDGRRFNDLLALGRTGDFPAGDFLELCNIDYLAPGDGANTGLAARSVDFHTSCSVFEHIPPEELSLILQEGNRVVKTDGLFVHRIDYSDHFSHSDARISAINFLQYSDAEWRRYAGNRYMYMNRLRHDDFMRLFQFAGHDVLEAETDSDPRSRELLQTRALPLDGRFSGKATEILSITGAWIVSAPRG
jgi:SAM-dependent methyltransferase